MKKIFLGLALMLTLVACSKSQTAENAANEIIGYMNQGDYTSIWTKYVSEQSKIVLAKDLEQLKLNPLGVMLFQTIGINDENLKTLTTEEYFLKTTKFYNEFMKDKEKTDKVVQKVEQNKDKAIIYWKQGATEAPMNIIKQDKRWYMDFEPANQKR